MLNRVFDAVVPAIEDAGGEVLKYIGDGVLAVCVQHEMDHLAGKLFVDYLSPLKREMVRKKLAKAKRAAA